MRVEIVIRRCSEMAWLFFNNNTYNTLQCEFMMIGSRLSVRIQPVAGGQWPVDGER
jgi:hypothetical protein